MEDEKTVPNHEHFSHTRPLLGPCPALATTKPMGQTIPLPKRPTTLAFTKTEPPQWLLAFWKEIDDKTYGEGMNCFLEDATCHLGVAEWNGREEIREKLRAFIDTGFTAHHEITEYWDGGPIKVFRGVVTMTPNDRSKPVVKPVMTHFFYMDEANPSKVRSWIGSVGPVSF